MSATPDPALFDKVVNLCKRRGFVFPSAEIYGGFRSTYDYGPLGSLLLRNIRDSWIRRMVQQRDDVVLIDAAILGPPQVWEASGHLASFSDPLVDCTNCKQRWRLDKLDDPEVCPNCGGRRVPAPGDRAGHVRQLRQCAADDAQEAAVRHRPDRQGLPERDHAAELD